MEVLTNIYYIIGLIFLYIELQSVFTPDDVLGKMNYFKERSNRGLPLLPAHAFMLFIDLFMYFPWLVIGALGTHQAMVFLTIMILSTIKKTSIVWMRWDGIFTSILLIFLLVNHFVLHINLGNLFR